MHLPPPTIHISNHGRGWPHQHKALPFHQAPSRAAHPVGVDSAHWHGPVLTVSAPSPLCPFSPVSDFHFSFRNLRCRLERMAFPFFHPRASALRTWWIASSSRSPPWRTAARTCHRATQTSPAPAPSTSPMAPSASAAASAPAPRAARPTVSPRKWALNWKTSWWTILFLLLA